MIEDPQQGLSRTTNPWALKDERSEACFKRIRKNLKLLFMRIEKGKLVNCAPVPGEAPLSPLLQLSALRLAHPFWILGPSRAEGTLGKPKQSRASVYRGIEAAVRCYFRVVGGSIMFAAPKKVTHESRWWASPAGLDF
jgi:hypothetical protein